jgi:hypothetical protein
MMRLRTILIAAAVLGTATAAAAADVPGDPMDVCKGKLEIFRIHKIKPTGTMAGFLKAAADHDAWFKSHGYTGDGVGVARQMEYDEKKKTFSFSEKEVVTVHFNPSGVPIEKQDADYKAFEKEYNDNADILTERLFCVGQK